jgi:hypothetical protein
MAVRSVRQPAGNIIKECVMKSTIRLLGIIALIAIIGFTMLACSSKADPDTDFRYEPGDAGQGMVITGYIGKNVNVAIPAKIQKIPVVEVRGFSNEKITSVIIPDSVKVIGGGAFRECPNITSVVIPANVKEIMSNAFQDCSNLTSVTFKGKDVIIGNEAFQGCRNLTNLVFSNGALKPSEYKGKIGPQTGLLGDIVYYTEHYYYNPGRPGRTGGYNEDNYVFYFHSGTTAFRYCDKLPPETLSKLKATGFLSTEEMNELERKAERGEL